jgi:hypothetical protein
MALAAAGVLVALGVNAGIASEPPGETATLALTNVRTTTVEGVRTRAADLTVRLSRPDLGRDGNWAYVLGWQGGARYQAPLERHADGTLTSTAPVPIGGTWKSFVRLHKGRVEISTAIRMPPDRALGFTGFPARARVTRPLVRDTKLLQIERKDDGPLWAWTPAMLLVMGLNLTLLALVGVTCVRAGRPAPTLAARAPAPR